MLRHGSLQILKAGRHLQQCSAVLPALSQVCCIPETQQFRHGSGQTRGIARLAEQPEDDVIDPSPRVKQIAEDIMHLNLLEVADLTDILQKRLGMNSMPIGMGGFGMQMQGMPGPAQAAAAPVEAAPAKVEEKTEFDVKLEGFDAAAKIKVIKEIRVITELGLKEAKELVEKSPVVIKTSLKKEEAEELKKKLEAVGGKVALE